MATQRPKPETPYPTAAVELPPEKLKRLLGAYQTKNQQEFHVVQKGDDVYCRLYGRRMKMLALSESEFLFEEVSGKLSFQMTENGQVESASLQLDAAGERIGKKKKTAPQESAK